MMGSSTYCGRPRLSSEVSAASRLHCTGSRWLRVPAAGWMSSVFEPTARRSIPRGSGEVRGPPNAEWFWQCALVVSVVEHYGSSEGMQICSNLLTPGRSKLGTVGVPWPDTILIVGKDGRPLPSGKQGEILVGGRR